MVKAQILSRSILSPSNLQVILTLLLAMASVKSEDHLIHRPTKTMRPSIAKLASRAGLAALVLGATQAAGAITITYSTTRATWVPNPNSLLNTRPLQYSAPGTALASGTRNFIYQDLLGDYAPAGNWIPVSQTGATAPGEQRFDYDFGTATTINSGPPQNNFWDNNSTLSFGSFYLDGSCAFCGPANAVSVLSSSLTGQAEYLGEAPGGSSGNQNKLTSSLYNIVFGASGKTATLEYKAFTDITNGVPGTDRKESSGGSIIIRFNDPVTAVPAPLSIFGAGAAFGFSRRLRRRIQDAAS